MTDKIKQFDSWFANAKSGDKYIYFTGNLAYSTCLADGLPLRQLRDHIMNKCCMWEVDDPNIKPKKVKKITDNKIQFKPQIRLVQKAQKKYWDKKNKDILRNSDYIAVRL